MSHDTELVHYACEQILLAFDAYLKEFNRLTSRARERFEARDWRGMAADARERLDVYSQRIADIVESLHHVLKDRIRDRPLWAAMKERYVERIADRPRELPATFFNSVTRRLFATVGVDPRMEFVDDEVRSEVPAAQTSVFKRFAAEGDTTAVVTAILDHFAFRTPYADAHVQARLVADAIERRCDKLPTRQRIDGVDMVKSVFYRGQRAMLVGRLRIGRWIVPLVIVLMNTDQGIVIDAVLTDEDDVSIVFSFTRSYLHVETDAPTALVRFLRSIMPLKRTAELFIAIGYNKHGKTELYRDLRHHLDHTADRFEFAPGEVGMVMIVFTMPGYDIVFKIIRDHFAPPKNTTRREVMDKYRLVFTHDRAGRLVDAQEFEHLTFARERFDPDLLEELSTAAAETVSVEGDQVHIRHLYTERRLTPLNIYLRNTAGAPMTSAVIDYGQAIKDLASTNIFPGDLLLKNFGVTRHGRVIFYDYDELCLLGECNFRDMPEPRTPEEEMSAEPWFYVGPHDIFPSEFGRFLGMTGEARQTFLDHHTDLLTARFWQELQQNHAAGVIPDISPYAETKRLGE